MAPRLPDNYVDVGSYLADREDFPNGEWADTDIYRVYVYVSGPHHEGVDGEFGSVVEAAAWAQEHKGVSEDDLAVLPDGVPPHITESEVDQHRARMERSWWIRAEGRRALPLDGHLRPEPIDGFPNAVPGWHPVTGTARCGRRAAVVTERQTLRHPDQRKDRPQPRAPGWMTWAPPAAVGWAVAYGSVRISWAIGDAPTYPPTGSDLIAFTGWSAVGLCAAAAAVALALRTAPWRLSLLVAAWGVSAALLVASALLLLDVVAGLFPGMWLVFHPVPFLSRVACLSGAVLVGAVAVAYRRRWRSPCLFCGRTRTREGASRPPRWAWWAAYAAVAGCLIRLGAQAAVGFGELTAASTAADRSVVMFEAGFLLAGTVLPLALVHSWGRVFPRWVPLLAGRRVPRWLVLGPAFGIAGGMAAYFGVAIMKLAAETLSGTWDQGPDALPLAFFWVAVPAYLTWGVGLGVAALGSSRVTRPQCRMCGR